MFQMVIQVKNNFKCVLPILDHTHEDLNIPSESVYVQRHEEANSLKSRMTQSSSDYAFVVVGYQLNTFTLSHSNYTFS
jgi:hypothetical protein